MFAFWSPGPTELIIILIVALLIFGKRLPDVARSLGKGIVEFKRGVRGIEDEIDAESVRPLPPADVKPEPTPDAKPSDAAEAPRTDTSGGTSGGTSGTSTGKPTGTD